MTEERRLRDVPVYTKQSGVVLVGANHSSLPPVASIPPAHFPIRAQQPVLIPPHSPYLFSSLHTYRYARSNRASAMMGVPAMSDVMTVELNLRS